MDEQIIHCHLRAEELAIRLFRAIADKIRENPEPILDDTRRNLERFKETHKGTGVMHYLNRWEKLLNGPLDELLAFMVSGSQEARDMRQAAPFAGILPNEERWDIIRKFSEAWKENPYACITRE
jgi:hypothetical protein